MEVILIKAAQLILILSIIVVLHEGGHFVAAKLFKTKVERFFLFFDVKFALFKKKIGETVYGIGWLPLGGYVKIAGMIDESMDTDQLKSEPKPWEFRSKPAWQRLIIMLAGIIVNLILSFVIFAFLSYKNGETYLDTSKMTQGIVVDSAQLDMGLQSGDIPIGVNGERYDNLTELFSRALIDGGTLEVKRGGEIVELPISLENRVEMLDKKTGFFIPAGLTVTIDSLLPDGNAIKNGLKENDILLSVNNKPVLDWGTVTRTIKSNAGNTIPFVVERQGKEETVEIPVNDKGQIGIATNINADKYMTTKQYSLPESMSKGVTKTFSIITDQAQSFALLWKLKGKAAKYLSGPIGIAKNLPSTWNWDSFWAFTAMLSAVLAFMNLLPIPGLDGGHAAFTIYEMITGHKPGDKFMGIMQMIGAVILIGLMIFAFGNDIFNLFTD